MAFSIQKDSGMKINGSPVYASYWHANRLNIDLGAKTVSIEMAGYSDQASFNADPSSYLTEHMVMYPSAGITQYPFDPTYLAANFSSAGVSAYMAAALAMVAQDPFFAGAIQVS